MVGYFAAVASGFCLGWLVRLWRTARADRLRRGGWLRPGASSTMRARTGAPPRTFFSSSPRLGQAWEAGARQEWRRWTSNISAPTHFGNATDGRETGLTRRGYAGSDE